MTFVTSTLWCGGVALRGCDASVVDIPFCLDMH